MTARQLFTRAAVCVLTCVLMACTSLLSAATLTWEGDLAPTDDVKWLGGIVDSDTNWTDGTAPTTDQKHPTASDDLVFLGTSTGAVYGGDLDLGGGAVEANGITVGQLGDYTVGGPSDLGASRILAKSSTGPLKLGSGGITVYVPAVEPRHVYFDSDIELTGATTSFSRLGDTSSSGDNSLYLRGVISGTSDVSFISNSTGQSKAVQITKNNTFVGDVTIQGTVYISDAGALGDDSNSVQFTGSNYFINRSPGATTSENNYELSSTGTTQFYRFGGTSWTLNGDVTGGASNRLFDIFGYPERPFIFSGDVQDFSNWVGMRGGTQVTITKANGGGVAWENAGLIRMNRINLSPTSVQGHLLLEGDFTLNQNIEVGNVANNNVARIGQVNDGVTPFDAIFNGDIVVEETDVQALHLVAGDGGSTTFNGEINVNDAGGGFGFDKTGLGTVIVTGRVSEDVGNLVPIGDVNVTAGTMLVNSAAGNESFHVSTINVESGAILGGTGHIKGDVDVKVGGSVAMGASIGTLTVDGNVNINGIMTAEADSLSSDLLVVSNTLTLDGASVLEITGTLDPFKTYTLAQAGTLSGTFGSVYLNGDLVPFGEAVGGIHALLYANNAVVLQGVPEPSSLLLLGMGVCVFARRGRRHGKRKVA